MKKVKNKRMVLLLAVVAISLMGYGTTPALEENKMVIEDTYESYNPDDEGIGQFNAEYSKDGKKYKLLEIKTEIIDSYPEKEETIIDVDSDRLYGTNSAEENPPAETIEQDGVYYLKSSVLLSGMTVERTENKKSEIEYNGVSYIDELPERGSVTVTDSLTGKQYKQELPRTDYRITGEDWVDDFSFPITIFSADADTYMLGTTEIPKEADLSQYGTEFLNVLGLSPDYYKIRSIELQDEPYEQDGEMIQAAIAHGSRRVANIVAVFEGNVTIPSEPYWYYQCEYSSIAPEEKIQTVYKIQATASYELVDKTEAATIEKTFWQQFIEFVKNPITIAVLLILFFIVMFLMLIKRKKKKDKPSVTYINDSDK
ncbi:hypothetical protein SAMN05443270_3477 [Lacrimispora sphenoides]|uniref:hypothetical protein n=1 Tax=Lacrimispora sphenoides TaxID=29370 RepID=UPI0008D4A1C8|nr:hypothetical protein [Lacrimispora sphenoides]SEU22379.1 hypothetical protein SAMN05443270_3477 [Lacrimispora sphenoides]